MILPNDKQEKSKFSSKVGGRCVWVLCSIDCHPFQGLRKMLLYAKTKHTKSYPWMRYIEEAVYCMELTCPLSSLHCSYTVWSHLARSRMHMTDEQAWL